MLRAAVLVAALGGGCRRETEVALQWCPVVIRAATDTREGPGQGASKPQTQTSSSSLKAAHYECSAGHGLPGLTATGGY